MIVNDDLGELSRVINYAPRVVNCAPGGHLLYCCHVWLSLSSLMIITYFHHLWSLLTVITHNHHLWSSLMIITYNHHLQSSLTIITYVHHLRLSLMIITYSHHLWSSLTIITYDHHLRSSLTIITYDHHLWSTLTISFMIIICLLYRPLYSLSQLRKYPNVGWDYSY
jgi:hypothetical protein